MKRREPILGRKCIASMAVSLLVLVLLASNSYADQWANTYGGEKADSGVMVLQTSDEGYLILGSTVSYSLSEDLPDLWVLKLDMFGQSEWQKIYGGNGTEEPAAIQQTTDGGYIIAANTDSFGSGKLDIWIIKTDEAGNIEWQNTYGGNEDDQVSNLQQTEDGGYVIAGSTQSFGAGKSDLWILKLDESGNVQWKRTYGGAEDDRASAIRQTSDEGYVIVGTTASFGAGGQDVWVLRLNEDGTVKWQKAYGGAGDDKGTAILKIEEKVGEEKKERFIVAGTTHSFGYGGQDAWLFKLDDKGNILWQRTYGGSAGDEPVHSIQQTSDEGYVLAGQTNSFGAGLEDVWIVKIDGNGSLQWQKTYGGDKSDLARSVIQTLDEGYVLVGSTDSSGAGNQDVWMLKLDFNGNIVDCPKQGTSYAGVRSTSISPKLTSATIQETSVLSQTSEGTSADTTVASDHQCLVSGPEIAIQPTSVDYESVIVGRAAIQTVTINNTGSQALVIETLDITGTDHLSFALLVDNCSNQTLYDNHRKCTVELLFLPTTKGAKNAFLHVLSNDPVKGDAYLSLAGEGIPSITLSLPANHASFSGCSMFNFPTFSWESEEIFKKYQVEFSPFESFSGLSMIFKTSKTEARMHASPWKIALRTPGGRGGPVHWRVVGFRTDGTPFASDSRTFIVEPAKPVGDPEISPTNKNSSPVISWKNHCNTKFKVVFGNDDQFSRTTTLSFNVKNPTKEEGKFTAPLKERQWGSIRKLVKDESGSRVYWKVESLDGASRSAVTGTLSFVLTD